MYRPKTCLFAGIFGLALATAPFISNQVNANDTLGTTPDSQVIADHHHHWNHGYHHRYHHGYYNGYYGGYGYYYPNYYYSRPYYYSNYYYPYYQYDGYYPYYYYSYPNYSYGNGLNLWFGF